MIPASVSDGSWPIPMQPKPTELKPLPPRHLYEINTACVVSVIPEACRYLPVAGEARQVLPWLTFLLECQTRIVVMLNESKSAMYCSRRRGEDRKAIQSNETSVLVQSSSGVVGYPPPLPTHTHTPSKIRLRSKKMYRLHLWLDLVTLRSTAN